ncbi:MAG: thermonuclease family protein, partial [Proteobacteria bacterium]|nr:thermonuclease family protein [Pseudomonadota bacterium]
TKAQNSFYYYTCIKDSKYTNDNERMGYDSWNWASQLLPFNAEIIVSCEKTLSDGSCGYDATRHRRLAYIGYERNNASYDFATEIAREGLAFANVEFASTTSKIGEICAAQKEAISAKRELWSLAPTVNGVLALMGRDKQRNLKNLESRCNAQMK